MSENLNIRLESIQKIDSGMNINNVSSLITKSCWEGLVNQDDFVNFAKNVIKTHESSKGVTEETFPGSEMVYIGAHAHASMFKTLTNINVSIIESLLLIKNPQNVFIGSAFTNFAATCSGSIQNLYGLNIQQTEYASLCLSGKIPEIQVVTHQSLNSGEFNSIFDVSIIRFDYVASDLYLLNSIINSTASEGLLIIPGSSDQGRLYKTPDSLSFQVHDVLRDRCKTVCHLPIGTGITIATI